MANMKLEEGLWLVATDHRGRVTLPKELIGDNHRFRITEEADGTLRLTPVVYVDKKDL